MLFRSERYGIKSVTMDDVSYELGISKKTLYNYVSNKEELVDKYIAYKINQRECSFNAIRHRELNAIEELLAVNAQVIEMLKNYSPSLDYDLKKYYPDHYNKLRKVRREHMYQTILDNIYKGKEQGLYREDLNPEIITKIHVSRIENSLANEIFSIEELTSEKFIREMTIYHIRAIANKTGIEFLERKMKEQGDG